MLNDRDYMRSGPGETSQGSFIKKAQSWSAIKTLVVLNVIFFALQILLVDSLRDQFGRTVSYPWFTANIVLVPELVKQGEVWRLLTHMFAHGDFFHILFNMFVLSSFGAPIEQRLGKKRFYYLYFFSGFISTFAYLAVNWFSNTAALGASGAVMGVFMTCALFMPTMKVYFFFVPIPIPIGKFVKWYAIASFAMLVGRHVIGPDFGPNWAHSAHLGGMLGGWLFVRYFTKTNLPSFDIFSWFSKLKAQKKRDTFTHVKSAGKSDATSEDVDRILDKISQSGLTSLTDKEKSVLDEARSKLRK